MSLTAIRSDANNLAVSWPVASRRRFGVPIGGPFDTSSFRLALALLGRHDGAGIEVGFMGGEWIAGGDCVLAHLGCRREVRIDGAVQDSDLLVLQRGQRVLLGPAISGHRSYIVVDPSSGKVSRTKLAPVRRNEGPIRVLLAPGGDGGFLDREFVVTPRINRLGLRLDTHADLAHSIELPSEPQCLGAIQITPDGTPIIIGPDGPTLGGYPKLGAVISADLDRIAQLRPGDKIRFEQSNLHTSKAFFREFDLDLSRQCRALRVAWTMRHES